MKIKGLDWMDWLHQIREESLEDRKKERRSLAQYLKTIEAREGLIEEKKARGTQKKRKK